MLDYVECESIAGSIIILMHNNKQCLRIFALALIKKKGILHVRLSKWKD